MFEETLNLGTINTSLSSKVSGHLWIRNIQNIFFLASVLFWKSSSVKEKTYLQCQIYLNFVYVRKYDKVHMSFGLIFVTQRDGTKCFSVAKCSAVDTSQQGASGYLGDAGHHTVYHERARHKRLEPTALKCYLSQYESLSCGTLQACLSSCQIKEVT